MHDYDVQTTLQDLGKAFEEFKSTQDIRLKHLETDSQAPADLEEKLDKLEKTIEATEQRLDTLQASKLRPQISPPNEENSHENTQFDQYIRKGLLDPMEQKTLSSDPDDEGGHLVPTGVDYHLRQVLQQQSVLRRLAAVRQISTHSLDLLIDKDMADAGWVTEKADRPETDTPKLDSIHLPVHEMYAKPRATQRLLDDANINVEEWICQKIAQKMAAMENEAFLLGDGNNKPKGILAHDLQDGSNWSWGNLEEIRTGSDGDFAKSMGVETLILTYHSLKPQYLHDACWLMSRTAQSTIRRLRDPHTNQYIWQPALTEGAVATLLGHPVHTCDTIPPLVSDTASPSILFGNFKEGYQIVDRQSTRVLRDPYSAKPFVEFYTTRRVGGDVVNFEAIKVVNFAA